MCMHVRHHWPHLTTSYTAVLETHSHNIPYQSTLQLHHRQIQHDSRKLNLAYYLFLGRMETPGDA